MKKENLYDPSRGPPLTSKELESHPLAVLYRALKELEQKAQSFEIDVQIACKRLRPLDQYPSHDTVLDEKTWQNLSAFPFNTDVMPLTFSMQRVDISIERLQDALSRIQGCYSEEMKARSEDRIAQSLEQLRVLQSDLSSLLIELPRPRQPNLIRHQSLSHLLRMITPFLLKVEETRKNLSGEDESQLDFAIEEQKKIMLSLKADLYRLRDNPNRRMAGEMDSLYQTSLQLTKSFRRLKVDAMVQCHHAGMRFYNRVGTLTLEKIEAEYALIE